MIAALLRLAETASTTTNPVAIQEARLVLREAHSLMGELEKGARGRSGRVINDY